MAPFPLLLYFINAYLLPLILFIINLFSAFQSSPPWQRWWGCVPTARNEEKKIGNVSKAFQFLFAVVNPWDLMALQCIEIKICTRTPPLCVYWFLFFCRITNNTSSLYLWQQEQHKQRERTETKKISCEEKTINPRGERTRAQSCTCSTATVAAASAAEVELKLACAPNKRMRTLIACKRFQFKTPCMFSTYSALTNFKPSENYCKFNFYFFVTPPLALSLSPPPPFVDSWWVSFCIVVYLSTTLFIFFYGWSPKYARTGNIRIE